MNELPQLPADFCEGYWQAVVEELMDGGLDAETAQAAVQEYREYMKPAGWTIYNDRIEESAKMAKLGLQN